MIREICSNIAIYLKYAFSVLDRKMHIILPLDKKKGVRSGHKKMVQPQKTRRLLTPGPTLDLLCILYLHF